MSTASETRWRNLLREQGITDEQVVAERAKALASEHGKRMAEQSVIARQRRSAERLAIKAAERISKGHITLQEYVQEVLDSAPSLDEEQRGRLADLLQSNNRQAGEAR